MVLQPIPGLEEALFELSVSPRDSAFCINCYPDMLLSAYREALKRLPDIILFAHTSKLALPAFSLWALSKALILYLEHGRLLKVLLADNERLFTRLAPVKLEARTLLLDASKLTSGAWYGVDARASVPLVRSVGEPPSSWDTFKLRPVSVYSVGKCKVTQEAGIAKVELGINVPGRAYASIVRFEDGFWVRSMFKLSEPIKGGAILFPIPSYQAVRRLARGIFKALELLQ